MFRPTWKGMRVENEDGVYVVFGEEIERLARKTDWDNPEGVEHFQRELERKGVVAALRRAGALQISQFSNQSHRKSNTASPILISSSSCAPARLSAATTPLPL